MNFDHNSSQIFKTSQKDKIIWTGYFYQIPSRNVCMITSELHNTMQFWHNRCVPAKEKLYFYWLNNGLVWIISLDFMGGPEKGCCLLFCSFLFSSFFGFLVLLICGTNIYTLFTESLMKVSISYCPARAQSLLEN